MLGRKLVKTTDEGRMNSVAPPPRLLIPRGKVPSCSNPISTFWPGAKVPPGGVNTYRCARSIGETGLPSIVQESFSQCRPPVSKISSSGFSPGLTSTYLPFAWYRCCSGKRSSSSVDMLNIRYLGIAIGGEVLSPVILGLLLRRTSFVAPAHQESKPDARHQRNNRPRQQLERRAEERNRPKAVDQPCRINFAPTRKPQCHRQRTTPSCPAPARGSKQSQCDPAPAC